MRFRFGGGHWLGWRLGAGWARISRLVTDFGQGAIVAQQALGSVADGSTSVRQCGAVTFADVVSRLHACQASLVLVGGSPDFGPVDSAVR